jgi:hypothetical protein
VIAPLARPRIPSVPKYLRTIMWSPRRRPSADPDINPFRVGAASKNIG